MVFYLLQAPSQKNLCRGLAVLLRQCLQYRLIHALGLHQRRVGLHHNIALLQPRGDVLAMAPRVNLVLADIDLAADAAVNVLLELIEMVNTVVGDANGADFSGLLRFDESPPGACASLLSSVWGVDQDSTMLLVNGKIFIRLVSSRERTGQCSPVSPLQDSFRWRL